jgi:alpha-L-fucosidase 2
MDMKWKDGKLSEVKLKSTIGGNCRLRVSNVLKLMGGSLKEATGKNPNVFFQYAATAPPIISGKARLKPTGIKSTLLYDFATKAGKTYTLVAAN